jgi:CDP-paratose 2-epimerase
MGSITICGPISLVRPGDTSWKNSRVELHGFLSYFIKCNLEEKTYKIFGYKGKQVRDNIHSLDVVRFISEFIRQPRIGEVYNLGGGRENSISILEAFDLITRISGQQMAYEYVDKNRIGDHLCYISDLSKMRSHYPSCDITKGVAGGINIAPSPIITFLVAVGLHSSFFQLFGLLFENPLS